MRVLGDDVVLLGVAFISSGDYSGLQKGRWYGRGIGGTLA